MSCPRMSGVRKRLCTAVEELVVLSSDELETYCDAGAYRNCPVFQELERRGRKVPLRDYDRLFEAEENARAERSREWQRSKSAS